MGDVIVRDYKLNRFLRIFYQEFLIRIFCRVIAEWSVLDTVFNFIAVMQSKVLLGIRRWLYGRADFGLVPPPAAGSTRRPRLLGHA